jgi:hypothetical protein
LLLADGGKLPRGPLGELAVLENRFLALASGDDFATGLGGREVLRARGAHLGGQLFAARADVRRCLAEALEKVLAGRDRARAEEPWERGDLAGRVAGHDVAATERDPLAVHRGHRARVAE